MNKEDKLNEINKIMLKLAKDVDIKDYKEKTDKYKLKKSTEMCDLWIGFANRIVELFSMNLKGDKNE